jgi:hypothetical protein
MKPKHHPTPHPVSCIESLLE